MKKFVFIIFAVFLTNILFAQKTITGFISDKNSNPIENVSVKVKFTNISTTTNSNGNYSITVPENYKTLEFSKQGYRVSQVEINNDKINFTLTSLEDIDIFELSLEELLNVEVVTASNKVEKLSEAPATTIVITKRQIQERGYKDLLDLLQDLPGIDMSVSYSDTYFKDYWRGYRNTIGSPYLFMIDGIVFNHLYFNHTTIMVAVPLSNIEQVEIVYGPASSVYGANAFMGVVNVITIKDSEKATSVTENLGMSTKGYSFADMNVFQNFGKTKMSITAKYESGNLNQRINNNDFYWLQDKFLTDTLLWGDFVNNPKVAGKFSSPIKNTGLDFRLYSGDLELGAQYFENYTGYGTVYPADKTTPQSQWILPEYSIYGRYTHSFSDNFSSSSIIRYRQTNLTSESQDLEGYNITNQDTINGMYIGNDMYVQPGETLRIIQYSYWQTLNSSRSVFQDFNWTVSERLALSVGLKYEDKNLQKAYNINHGEIFFPDSLERVSDALPISLSKAWLSDNRINWIDKSVYLQSKYRISKNSIVNLGFRVDNNSFYGTTPTLRAGFIQTVNKFTIKLLYGQAYQEPVPRNLYGGWSGSGSDPNLIPENSQTAEINCSFLTKSINNLLSVWWVNNKNTIINYSGGAKNIGGRTVFGLDYHLQMEVPLFRSTQIWAYYSLIIKEEEVKFNSEGIETGVGEIGDLSHNKIHFGINSYILKDLNLNLKGQYRGVTKTVSTNPLKTVPAYFILDGNLSYNNFLKEKLKIGISVTNILNTIYFHPGIRQANSGNTGGTWDGRAWNGSAGWYNSYLVFERKLIFN